MCQIQLIKVLKGRRLAESEIDAFDTLMRSGSWANKDAWGFFTNKGIYKQAGAYYDQGVPERIGKLKTLVGRDTRFIVGHNRLTTQGGANRNHNNHPFETRDLVLVHNGIISNENELNRRKDLRFKGETDSLTIIHALQAKLSSGSTILEAIKVVAENLEGSFSVLLYYKTDGNLYYFKNGQTSFYFGLKVNYSGRRVLLGSTDKDNFKELFLAYDDIFSYRNYKKMMVESATTGMIYLINEDHIVKASRFTPKAVTISSYCGYDKDDYEGYCPKVWESSADDYKDYQYTLETGSQKVQEILKDFLDIDATVTTQWKAGGKGLVSIKIPDGEFENLKSFMKGYGDFSNNFDYWEMNKKQMNDFIEYCEDMRLENGDTRY